MTMIDILPEIRPLLDDSRLNELGPGSPNFAVKPLLQELARELPKKAMDPDFAAACLAGLWLLHDFQDESHAISQDLDTLEGSYWHGILHRREPDYGNAKYWFRRVPGHPIFAALCEQAGRASAVRIPGPAKDVEPGGVCRSVRDRRARPRDARPPLSADSALRVGIVVRLLPRTGVWPIRARLRL
jgi:hypothetical protein